MKATGFVRQTDDLGRIVIPKSIREAMDIKEGEPMEFFTDGNMIILKPYHSKKSTEFYKELQLEQQGGIQ